MFSWGVILYSGLSGTNIEIMGVGSFSVTVTVNYESR